MPSGNSEKSEEDRNRNRAKLERLLNEKEIDPEEIIEALDSDNSNWVISVQTYLSEGNGTVSLKEIEGYSEALKACFERLLKKRYIDEALKCKEKLGDGIDFTDEIKAALLFHLTSKLNGIADDIIEKFSNDIDLTEVATLAIRERVKKELDRTSNRYAKCGLKVDPALIKNAAISGARAWEKEVKSNGDKS